MAKNGKKGLLKEFRDFAVKGNMFDLAVGVIIGGAFQSLVSGLTDKVLMPIISIFTGGLNFSEWKIALPHLFGEVPTDPATGEVIVNYLLLGDFVSSVLNFIIMAFVVFMIVKGMNRLRDLGKKKEEAPELPAEPPKPSNEEVLLTEIRDLLKEKN